MGDDVRPGDDPGGPHARLPSPAVLECSCSPSPRRWTRLARAAGFAERRASRRWRLTAEYGSLDDYWGSIMDMAANTSALVATLPEAARTELRDAIERDAEPYRAENGGYRFPAASVIAVMR